MGNPYQPAIDFAAGSVIQYFLLPVGAVIVLGTIVFGLLERNKPRRRSRRR